MSAITDPPQLVIASGCCVRCDFSFTDELVAAWPDRAAPGGLAYVELRHLSEPDIEIPPITTRARE